jgi:PBSX family phage terminase large subunit
MISNANPQTVTGKNIFSGWRMSSVFFIWKGNVMGIKELKEVIEKKKKQQSILNEIKKRSFIKKYFGDETDKQLVSDIKVTGDSFNEAYMKTFNNDKRVNIYYGGSSSGKSEYIARRYILKFLFEQGHNGLFLRKFATDVRKSIYQLLLKISNEYLGDKRENYIKVNKSDMTFTFYNGNQILLQGLDDTEKIKSITFSNGILTDVFFEECNQGNGTEIKELKRRIRGITPVKKEITLAFNPVSKSNWVYQMFFNMEIEAKRYHLGKNLLILKTNIYDNKYATEEDRQVLEDESDKYDREVYLYGNFGVLSDEDNIIPYSDCMHCTDHILDTEGAIYIGVDCAGMGKDKTVAKVRKGAVELDRGFELGQVEEQVVVDNLIMLIQDLQDEYQIEGEEIPEITVNIDTTGVGYGVGSQMRTAQMRKTIVNVEINDIAFGGSANNSDKYFNVVTEMYFNIRNLVTSRSIQLLKDDETINELCSRKFTIEESKSRRRIEEKKKFKKRLSKSPDKADALVMAFYVPNVYQGVIDLDEIEYDYPDDYWD